MKKTSTRLASLGGFVLLGACAIALAQRDSRKRESEPLEFAGSGQTGAQLIQVDSDWSPPYGKQKTSPVVRANNDDRTSYTLNDDENPLRGDESSSLALPDIVQAGESKIRTAGHSVPLNEPSTRDGRPMASVRLASGEVPSDPPAWARQPSGNRYPNPGTTSDAARTVGSALPPGGPRSLQNNPMNSRPAAAGVNPALPSLPGYPLNSAAPSGGSATAVQPPAALVAAPNGMSQAPGLPQNNRSLGGNTSGTPSALPALPPIASGNSGGLSAPSSPYANSTPTNTRSLTDQLPGSQTRPFPNGSGNSSTSQMPSNPSRELPPGNSPSGRLGALADTASSLPAGNSDAPTRNSMGSAAPTGNRRQFEAPQSRVSDLSDTQRGVMAPTDLTQRPSSASSPPAYGNRNFGDTSGRSGTNNSNVASANWPPNQDRSRGNPSNNSATQGTPSIPSLNSRASFNATSTSSRPANPPQMSNSGSSQGYTSRSGTSAQLTGLVSNRPGDRFLDGSQNPIMLIQKRAPEEIRVGKPTTFVIAVRNAGNAVAHGVTVLDSVPSGSKFVESNPPARPDSQGMLTWKLGEIAAGEEQTIKLVLVPEVQGEVGSVATVHFAARASVRTVATMPKLELELQTDSQVLIGDRQEIQVVLRNVGTGMARGIRLEADIPDQLKHESGDTQLEAVLGDLRPSESRQITLNTAAVLPGRSICNIRAVDEDGVSATEEVKIDVKAPNLVASIQGPKLRYLERQATYKIAVQNNGTATATNLQFVARLPAGLKFNAADIHGQYDPNSHTVRWGLHELPAGQTAPIEVTVLPVELGPQVISFDASADLDISTESKAQVVVDGLSELAFSVGQDDGTIEVGAIATYSVQIANVGNKADGKVELSVELPPGAQLVSVVNAPVEFRTAGNQIVFAPIQEIRNKDKYTYRFQVKHTQAGKQIVRTKLVSANWPNAVVKEEGTLVYDDNH